MKSLRFFSLILVFSSCSYRWQPDFPKEGRPTISIPFIQGDEDGTLTSEIIGAISSSGVADVRSHSGEYTLEIAIVSEASEKIGFRVDPQKVHGEVKKNLLASEGRRSITIEMTLCLGGEVVNGPYRITADADFDYVDGDSIQDLTFVNTGGATLTVLPFSLGQLESNESAALAATKPLYRSLAQKVVDAISSEW